MVNSSRKRKLVSDSSEDSASEEPIQVRSRRTLKRFGNAAQLNISESDENDQCDSEDDYSPQPKNQKTTPIEKPIEKKPNFLRNFDHEFDKLGTRQYFGTDTGHYKRNTIESEYFNTCR